MFAIVHHKDQPRPRLYLCCSDWSVIENSLTAPPAVGMSKYTPPVIFTAHRQPMQSFDGRKV